MRETENLSFPHSLVLPVSIGTSGHTVQSERRILNRRCPFMLNRSTALIPLAFTLACLAPAPASAQVSFASPFGFSGRFMPFRPLGRVAPQSLGYQPTFRYFENNFQS